MKKAILVRPHIHKTELPFQLYFYEEWKNKNLPCREVCRPTWRWLFHLVNRISLPRLCVNDKEARIVLIGGGSVNWGAWPDYMFYEIIPLIWDCWPIYYDRVFGFIDRYDVKTIIVTSKQTANIFKARWPNKHILYVSEGILTSLYCKGNSLQERNIDILEYGRRNNNIPNFDFTNLGYNHVRSTSTNRIFHSERDLIKALSDSKISLVFPRCDTHPEVAGGIETMTQRYWECMLSRVLMVGRSPQELIELIGYDPVITIDKDHIEEQFISLLNRIGDYQALVDRNYCQALKFASWDLRFSDICDFLRKSDYVI